MAMSSKKILCFGMKLSAEYPKNLLGTFYFQLIISPKIVLLVYLIEKLIFFKIEKEKKRELKSPLFTSLARMLSA